MKKHKIEKHVILSKPKTCKKYPFEEMEVGDSFIIGEYTRYNMTIFSNAARSWNNRRELNRKFVVRKVENNKVRIWRIK